MKPIRFLVSFLFAVICFSFVVVPGFVNAGVLDDYPNLTPGEQKALLDSVDAHINENGDIVLNDPDSVQSPGGEPLEDYVGESVLPYTLKSTEDCKKLMNKVNNNSAEVRDLFHNNSSAFDVAAGDILGCAIKTGDVKLWMLPYYIRYILEFLIRVAGLVAVGGTVYGGYLLLFAGLSDDKDKGKKAVFYSVGGFIMVLVAWAVVNVLISLVTSF